MSDHESTAHWPTWEARIGYYTHERERKVLAEVRFRAPNLLAAASWANRLAQTTCGHSGWGAYSEVVVPTS